MKRLMLIFLLVALVSLSCKKDSTKSTNTGTSYSSLIVGRWKLIKAEIYKNQQCTTIVNNINHPNLWIEFSNVEITGGDCASYKNMYHDCLWDLYFCNCDCQTVNFSSLNAGCSNGMPGFTYSLLNYAYNISGDRIYLCGGIWINNYLIQELTSNTLVLVEGDDAKYYFVRM